MSDADRWAARQLDVIAADQAWHQLVARAPTPIYDALVAERAARREDERDPLAD